MRILVVFMLLLTGCTGVPKGIEPVTDFELGRYLGTWYEIVRLDHSFERNLENVTAAYTVRDDGAVTVQNRGYNVRKQRWESVEGRARFAGASDLAHLEVSFFGPFYASYIVFDLDDDYRYALVTGASRSWFWILAREPVVDPVRLDALLARAASQGFDLSSAIKVRHAER
jgi:apolipoprotein D and lipocalin family protein